MRKKYNNNNNKNNRYKKRYDKKQPEEKTSFDREKQEEDFRLNKYIAHCGICSRRKADDLIKAGRIKVNETLVDQPGHKVNKNDTVYLDGKEISLESKLVYILMNKPKNTITSLKDEKGRRTVIDLVRNACEQRVYPVGRLDRDTTGLLVITNDGDLAKKLSHPSHSVSKVYHAKLDKVMTKEDLEKIQKGLTLEDGLAPVVDAQFVIGSNHLEVGVEIHIGRNRIVRRIFEHLGYEVVKLDRVYYAGLTKRDVPRGKWRFLKEKEIIMLKHFS